MEEALNMTNESTIQLIQPPQVVSTNKPNTRNLVHRVHQGGETGVVNPLETLSAIVERQETTAVGMNLPDARKGSDQQNELTGAQLQETVENINGLVQNLQRDLQFTVDETTGKSIVMVIDAVTDEIIRQIPSDEFLAIARHIQENQKGGLFTEQA